MSNTDTSAPTCKNFVSQAWNDHATNEQAVFDRLPEGIALIGEAGDLAGLAGLIVHVAGEHLGRWQDGLDLLGELAAHETYDATTQGGQAVLRSQAVLHFCSEDMDSFAAALAAGHPQGDLPEASTRARVLAIAAGALAAQQDLDRSIAAFNEAIGLLAYGPAKGDPAVRSLAITGNNLACELEEKSERSEGEDALLELAAKTARRFWEQAGTWSNVKAAEYRLCMTYLALGQPQTALKHADLALACCDANDADESERFFPHEARARAQHALGDLEAAAAERAKAAVLLPSFDASWGDYPQKALDKLDRLLGS